jgi:hypothetical protein
MDTPKPASLEPGVYRIWWEDDGGSSVGAVGEDARGNHWYAPANWISGMPCRDWARVKGVHLIAAQAPQPEPPKLQLAGNPDDPFRITIWLRGGCVMAHDGVRSQAAELVNGFMTGWRFPPYKDQNVIYLSWPDKDGKLDSFRAFTIAEVIGVGMNPIPADPDAAVRKEMLEQQKRFMKLAEQEMRDKLKGDDWKAGAEGEQD